MTAAQPRRRWFRFSLRSFLLLVLVGGSVLGWQMHIVHERKKLRDWLEFRDAEILTLDELLAPGRKTSNPGVDNWGQIGWQRRLLGDEGVLWITVPENVADDAAQHVVAAFPEAHVELKVREFAQHRAAHAQTDDEDDLPDPFSLLGRPPVLSDQEYALVKQRIAEDRAYDKAFERLIQDPASQPSEVNIVVLAPLAAKRLRSAALVSYQAEVLTLDVAIEYCRTAAELFQAAARAEHRPGDPAALNDYRADLAKLQESLAEQHSHHSRASRLFNEALLLHELARPAAEAAAVTDPAARDSRFITACDTADALCTAAEKARAEETIPPDTLVHCWELRRAARLAAADFATDKPDRRAAWQEYADAVGQRLAAVEKLYEAGVRGGEAEKYWLLKFCAAKGAAELARHGGDQKAELAAVRSGAEAGDTLYEATKVAYEAETVTVDCVVDAINCRAAAERRLAELNPADAEARNWQQRQADTLHLLTVKLYALRMVSDGGYSSDHLYYVASQYMLVRLRMAEKAGR